MDRIRSTDYTVSYFKTTFPHRQLFDFYKAHTEGRPENREFCIEAAEWRRRFQDAETVDRLEKLTHTNGIRALHAGAVYSQRASQARVPGVVAMHRELVFDLDLQDVPWISGDKSDLEHGDRFMPLIFASANILKVLLEQIFDFKSFMLVYSGRRGVHLYVLDRRAFELSSEGRKAVCAMVSLPPRHKAGSSTTFLNTFLNPSVESPEVAESMDYAIDVAMSADRCNMLGSRVDIAKFAAFFSEWDSKTLPSPCRETTTVALCQCESPGERFQYLMKTHRFAFRDALVSIVWPRCDAEVTSSLQHTIKTPFSLHASTGRVALPLPIDAFEQGWHPSRSSLENVLADRGASAHAPQCSFEGAIKRLSTVALGIDAEQRALKRKRDERPGVEDW